jgi:hypothetical protein
MLLTDPITSICCWQIPLLSYAADRSHYFHMLLTDPITSICCWQIPLLPYSMLWQIPLLPYAADRSFYSHMLLTDPFASKCCRYILLLPNTTDIFYCFQSLLTDPIASNAADISHYFQMLLANLIISILASSTRCSHAVKHLPVVLDKTAVVETDCTEVQELK